MQPQAQWHSGANALGAVPATEPARPGAATGTFEFLGAPAPAPAPEPSIYSDAAGFRFLESATPAHGFDLLGAPGAPAPHYGSAGGGVDLFDMLTATTPTQASTTGSVGGEFHSVAGSAPSATSSRSHPTDVHPCTRCYVGNLSAIGVCSNSGCATHESSIYDSMDVGGLSQARSKGTSDVAPSAKSSMSTQARTVRIIRSQPGTALGIILRTSFDGHVICAEAQGAAAAAGVVPGSRVLGVAGWSMEGQTEGAVVATIQRLAPGSPVDLVLAPPAPNWQRKMLVSPPVPSAAVSPHVPPAALRVPDYHTAAGVAAGNANAWQKKQAKQQAKLQKMRAELERKQQAERAELARIAQLPLTQRAEAAREKPRWIPDVEATGCMICAKPFTMQKSMFKKRSEDDRRQHCHYCGWAVCGLCSPRKVMLHRWLEGPIVHRTKSRKALRVCRLCDEKRVDQIKPKLTTAEKLARLTGDALDKMTDVADLADVADVADLFSMMPAEDSELGETVAAVQGAASIISWAVSD
jgi:hypothetical protein